MSKNKTQPLIKNPKMTFVLTFFILEVVNKIVIYFANLWFPEQVVLGTMSLSPNWAIMLSAAALALIGTLAVPFLTEWELRRKKDLSSMEWKGAYLLINFAGLWSITRFSEVFGLGVTSWMVVLGLAVAMDILQGIAIMGLEVIKKKYVAA